MYMVMLSSFFFSWVALFGSTGVPVSVTMRFGFGV